MVNHKKRKNGEGDPIARCNSKKYQLVDLRKTRSFCDWNENTDTGYLTDTEIEEGKIVLYNSCN